MAQTFKLEVVTPDKKVLSEEVQYAGVPGLEGEFGVLPQHIPFLSALGIGKLQYDKDGQRSSLFVSGGFAEVGFTSLSILAEAAEKTEDIDRARAEQALKRAEKRLAQQEEGVDIVRAKMAMTRALGRLQCVGR